MHNKTKISERITKITAQCLVAVLVAVGILFTAPAEPAYADSVIIGEAASGESGLSGNKAGDQTGSEVSCGSWVYGGSSDSPHHWNYVLRAKDPSIAKKIAKNMIAACDNDYIGYDLGSPDRTSLYDTAQAYDWDIAAIEDPCETTCSCVVSVCLNAAGIDVPRNWASGVVPEDVMATGQFECYTSSDYTASSAKLLPGDILVSTSHTAMVVKSPNPFEFDVTYRDAEYGEQTIKVAEGEMIQMNFNNGAKIKSLKIEDSANLNNYEPVKKNAAFAGWEFKDNNIFAASYRPNVMAIGADSKKVKIQN